MEISYPVFKLGTEQPIVENGVVLYINIERIDDEEKIRFKIVDDRNIEGETLAARRLKLLLAGVPLKRIHRAVFFLGDLVKIANSSTWFIDNKGSVFKYKKNTSTKLTYKRITNVINIKSGGAIIEVEGHAARFKSLFAPMPDEKFAGVLHYGISYILYGFYKEKHKDSWRMI